MVAFYSHPHSSTMGRRRSLLLCGVLCLTGQGGGQSIGDSANEAKSTSSKRHTSSAQQRRRRSQTFRDDTSSNSNNRRRVAELSYQWLFGYAKSDSSISATSVMGESSYIGEPEMTTNPASSDCFKEIEQVLSNPDVESEYGFENYQPDPKQQLAGCDLEAVDTTTPRTSASNRVSPPVPQPTSRPGRPARLPGDKEPPIASSSGDVLSPSPSSATPSASSPPAPLPPIVSASRSEDREDEDNPGFVVPKYGKKTPNNGMTGKKSSMNYAPAASSDVGKKTGKKQAPSAPTPTQDLNPPIVSLSPTSSPAPTGECVDPRTCGRPPRPI